MPIKSVSFGLQLRVPIQSPRIARLDTWGLGTSAIGPFLSTVNGSITPLDLEHLF